VINFKPGWGFSKLDLRHFIIYYSHPSIEFHRVTLNHTDYDKEKTETH